MEGRKTDVWSSLPAWSISQTPSGWILSVTQKGRHSYLCFSGKENQVLKWYRIWREKKKKGLNLHLKFSQDSNHLSKLMPSSWNTKQHFSSSISWGNSVLSFIVAVPFHIPTHSASGLPFLHTFSNTCCFLGFGFFFNGHSNMCEVTSQFSFVVNKWCWAPFHILVGHLYACSRNVGSSHLPICNQLFLFCYWVVSVLSKSFGN